MRIFLTSWFNALLLSSDKEGVGRLKTEPGSAAYDEGRKFRADFDFDSADTFPIVIKFVTTKDIDLTLSTQDIYDGSLRYRVYASGVEGGTFDATIPAKRMNLKSGVPIVDPGVVITTGGTLDVTGVERADITYLRTSGASGQRETVSGLQGSERGFPAATFYVVIDKIQGLSGGATNPSGVVKYEWTVSR